VGRSVIGSRWRKVGICDVVGVWESIRMEVLSYCSMQGNAMFQYRIK
jgi:hypothetical protein